MQLKIPGSSATRLRQGAFWELEAHCLSGPWKTFQGIWKAFKKYFLTLEVLFEGLLRVRKVECWSGHVLRVHGSCFSGSIPGGNSSPSGLALWGTCLPPPTPHPRMPVPIPSTLPQTAEESLGVQMRGEWGCRPKLKTRRGKFRVRQPNPPGSPA